MFHYAIRRLLWLIPTILAMALVTFGIMHATPGSPLDPGAEGANPLSPEAQKNLAAVKPQSAQDVRQQSRALIAFPAEVAEEEAAIKRFLYQHMYRHKRVMRVMGEAEQILFDLFAKYLTSPGELNPFLGVRGIRLSLAHPEVFRVQLRALARAAAVGPLKVMLPMITIPAEIEEVRQMLAE